MARRNKSHEELIDAARQVVAQNYKPNQTVVGSALRLKTGQIVTGVQLDGAFGHIVCAEAVALGRAVAQYKSSKVQTIVAVCHREDGNIDIVAPCGMCRELVRNYAPSAWVIMPGLNGEYLNTKLKTLA